MLPEAAVQAAALVASIAVVMLAVRSARGGAEDRFERGLAVLALAVLAHAVSMMLLVDDVALRRGAW